MIVGNRLELHREMKVCPEARKVVVEASWLVCWLFRCQTSSVLSRPIRGLPDELAKRVFHVAKVILLEAHMVNRNLMYCDLDNLAEEFSCANGRYLTVRSGPITVQLFVQVPISRLSNGKGSSLGLEAIKISPSIDFRARYLF